MTPTSSKPFLKLSEKTWEKILIGFGIFLIIIGIILGFVFGFAKKKHISPGPSGSIPGPSPHHKPSGLAPSGPAPSGLAPSGLAPSGPPSGPAPSGPAPSGPAPSGPPYSAPPGTWGGGPWWCKPDQIGQIAHTGLGINVGNRAFICCPGMEQPSKTNAETKNPFWVQLPGTHSWYDKD